MRIEKRLTQIPQELPLPTITIPKVDETVDEEKIESAVVSTNPTFKRLFTLGDDNDNDTSQQKQTMELEVWQDNSLVNYERRQNLPSNKSDIYRHLGLRKSALSASLVNNMSASSARVENMILNGSPSVITNSFTYTNSQYDPDADVIKVDNICVESIAEFDLVDSTNGRPSSPSAVMDDEKDLFPSLEFDAEMIPNERIDGSFTTTYDEPSLSSRVHQRRRIAMAVVIG